MKIFDKDLKNFGENKFSYIKTVGMGMAVYVLLTIIISGVYYGQF